MPMIAGLFDDYYDAKLAVELLEDAGIAPKDISIISRTLDGRRIDEGENQTAADATTGSGIGAAAGAAGGLLAGLGAIAIPGIGPVVAAGWLITTLIGAAGGAVLGGATGGIIGALTGSGISEDDANVYAESVRRGGALVIARVGQAQLPLANEILDRVPRIDVAARRAFYHQSGWDQFDEKRGLYDPPDRDPIHYAPPPRV
ncbi:MULTISPECIES: hypothetical protein [unclassified Rhizobium]|uniref:hypothetical protein n=1 Tax=unclassified Rhizobium TaxID=2613769 RepID=UPI001199EB18|nr:MULTISPECIES: hypothetical protein [unclassified Rhizobium]MBB3287077.1 hypothetical protein [Rhizobium sp. BK252]MBB3401817.1 hypothetical protein [Rhizobium sp. BK289]MBB3414239.1 hypothetical protein [Rhizobium sp. BK284]MBB3482126.1 hypothetical protein [Rhizobium sp. BK347]